jgi:hypothetical protein
MNRATGRIEYRISGTLKENRWPYSVRLSSHGRTPVNLELLIFTFEVFRAYSEL